MQILFHNIIIWTTPPNPLYYVIYEWSLNSTFCKHIECNLKGGGQVPWDMKLFTDKAHGISFSILILVF